MSKLTQNLKRITLVLLVVFGMRGNAKAQVDSMFLDPKYDIEVLLPPLDSIYEIAKAINPELKQMDAAMRAGLWAADYNKWSWGQNVYVFFNYSFGSLPFFAYNEFSNPLQPGLVQVKQGYRAGINLQVSVFDIMGNRGRVNEHKERALINRHQRDVYAMELKRKMANLYADMVGFNKLYKGRNEDLLTQIVACQVAEKEYREGAIHISEYARQKNVLADAEAAYNEAFRFYFNSLEQFEAVIGVPLSSIMRKPTKP